MTAKGTISHRREDLTGSTFGRLRVLALIKQDASLVELEMLVERLRANV